MAASYGTVTLRGKSGQAYIKDIYLNDTANALARWDGGAGASATSPDFWETPEPCVITSLNIVSATGQTRTQVTVNGNPTANIIRNSQHIPSATIIGLPYLGVLIPANVKLGLIQLA